MSIPETLKSLGIAAESVERIRLGRGVVGKTSIVAISAMIVLGIVASRLKSDEFLFTIGLAVLIGFIIYFFTILKFAKERPGEALLEGAELLVWKKYDLAAKDVPKIPESPSITDPKGRIPTSLLDNPDE